MACTQPAQSIMVVGGHGFLGRRIVLALADVFSGSVIVADVNGESIDPRTHFHRCDITDEVAVYDAIATYRPMCIVHVAAALPTHSADAHWLVNYGGTRHMLSAAVANGVSSFIYTSDACVVFDGAPLEGVDEESRIPQFAAHSYSDSKVSAERLTEEFRGRNGLRTCILRPSYIFGPGTSFVDTVMSLSTISKSISLEIGINNNLADWVYVDNVAHAHVLAAQRLLSQGDIDGETFLITNDEPRPFWDVPKAIWFRLGHLKIPGWRITQISPTLATYLVGLAQIIGLTSQEFCVLQQYFISCSSTPHWFDISRAKLVLGYAPPVTLAEGIRRTVEVRYTSSSCLS